MDRLIRIFFIIILFSTFCAKPGGFGSIKVSSTPTGARVYLDGEDTGKETDCVLDSVPAGEHTIKLRKADYLDYEKEVIVESDEEVEVSFTLISYYGSIKVSSNPPGAKVYLDGNDTGEKTYCILDRVLPGEHTIKLTKTGYIDYERDVTVESGKEVKLSVTLEEMTCWVRSFGGGGDDVGYSVQQTSDGGYIITGETDSYGAGKHDLWLIKTDVNGNKEWERTLGGSGHDVGYSIQETSDGGYIITGATTSYGTGWNDVWLIKIDKNGNKEWDRTFGGGEDDVGYSVQKTTDGGYVITGWTESYGEGGADVWLIKTDREGNKEWERTFGGGGDDVGYSVQQTSDGGYIITGVTKLNGSYWSNVWLIKTDAEGNKEWDRTFGGGGDDVGYSVQQTTDGGYIITGYICSYGAGNDLWLIKTDAEGNKEWDRVFGGGGDDVGYAVQQTSDGGYIITGTTTSYGAGWGDVWLIKTDAEGNKEWDRTFGGSDKDIGHSVQQTTDGAYIITGWTWSYRTYKSDALLIKTDRNGDVEWR